MSSPAGARFTMAGSFGGSPSHGGGVACRAGTLAIISIPLPVEEDVGPSLARWPQKTLGFCQNTNKICHYLLVAERFGEVEGVLIGTNDLDAAFPCPILVGIACVAPPPRTEDFALVDRAACRCAIAAFATATKLVPIFVKHTYQATGFGLEHYLLLGTGLGQEETLDVTWIS